MVVRARGGGGGMGGRFGVEYVYDMLLSVLGTAAHCPCMRVCLCGRARVCFIQVVFFGIGEDEEGQG